MSNDVAYPVFRTSDLGLALSTARRLMEFGRREGQVGQNRDALALADPDDPVGASGVRS